MAKEIAYIIKGFPRLSETFISNEISLLEQSEVKIRIFSIKRPDEVLLQSSVSTIKAPLIYLPVMSSLSRTFLLLWLIQNISPFFKAHCRLAWRYPLLYLQTFLLTLQMTLSYRQSLFAKPKKVFIKEFIQAGFIAHQIAEAASICHIHAHFCHGATTVARFVSRLTGIPYSFTAHAKDIYQSNQNPGDLLNHKIEDAAFVATCTGANKKFLDKLTTDSNKVQLIYHGLDVNFFSPHDNLKDKQQNGQILSVGRFVEKKGFNFLLQACAILAAKGHEFHCRIIGEQGEAYSQLQEMIKQLSLEKRVSLQPPMAHDQLMQVYQQCRIFALPCQIVDDGDRDGIPNVLVEAMACGLAVVSTEISGIPELIKDQQNGLLVAQKDAQALSSALEILLTQQQFTEKLSQNARLTVIQAFDSSCTTRQLKRLFDQCIDTKMQKHSLKGGLSNASR